MLRCDRRIGALRICMASCCAVHAAEEEAEDVPREVDADSMGRRRPPALPPCRMEQHGEVGRIRISHGAWKRLVIPEDFVLGDICEIDVRGATASLPRSPRLEPCRSS